MVEEDRQLNYLGIEFYNYGNMEKGITERERERAVLSRKIIRWLRDNHEG